MILLAVGALLLLQLSHCMPATASQQMRQCCGAMPCAPVNQSHDCCKTMVSSQTPQVLPVARVLFTPPAVATVRHLPSIDIARFIPDTWHTLEALRHSPPELYTLHLALLI